jgi:PAS domain S-box-containing protein
MGPWRAIVRQFSLAQNETIRNLAEAKTILAHERGRLQTLIEKIPDALIMTNMRGEVTFFNTPAMSILGARSADVRDGDKALFTPLQPELWRMPVQNILKHHSAGQCVEVKAVDDSIATYRTTVTILNESVAGDFGVLVMLRDVTAERRLEAAKEEFFQSAAHDLRAPLFAIQGYLRLLRKALAPDDEKPQSYLKSIDQSCEKLTMFVNDALDFARLDNGHLRLSPVQIDARALVRRAVSVFRPLADERGLILEARVDEHVAVGFEADERLMERLLHNLLSNALKFTPRGGHVIVQVIQSGDRLEFSVEDDGPGVPENMRTVIFEKFRQLDNPGLKSSFGLGLSICAKIVKLHNGLIWVEPGTARGARFVARLPLIQRLQHIL